MKINFSFSKLLDNDKFLKLFSVITAIIVWFIVALSFDTTGGVDIIDNIKVNLNLQNTPAEVYGLSVIEGNEQTVSVKVEGKRYKIGNLTADDFIAVPTLTNVTKSGEFDISVEVKKVNASDTDYTIISPPSTIKVKFDQLMEVTLPIQASAENIKAEQNFIKEEPIANPDSIVLTGPKSEIDNISKCVVVSEEDDIVSDSVNLEGNLVFYDQNNNKLTLKHTTYENQQYTITVPINKLKTVPITFTYVNVPLGLDASKLEYTMSTTALTIAGPQKNIDEIKEISLGEIDFRNIDVGYTPELDVDLLPVIVNVDNIKTVTIEFGNQELQSKQFNIPKANIITRNEPASYSIKIDTLSINNVKMVGNSADIEGLSHNDLIAVVDFAGKEISDGTSRVQVTIYATGNKFVWAVGEYKVLVRATKTE